MYINDSTIVKFATTIFHNGFRSELYDIYVYMYKWSNYIYYVIRNIKRLTNVEVYCDVDINLKPYTVEIHHFIYHFQYYKITKGKNEWRNTIVSSQQFGIFRKKSYNRIIYIILLEM